MIYTSFSKDSSEPVLSMLKPDLTCLLSVPLNAEQNPKCVLNSR